MLLKVNNHVLVTVVSLTSSLIYNYRYIVYPIENLYNDSFQAIDQGITPLKMRVIQPMILRRFLQHCKL